MPTAERVLLDTHVLVWWKAGGERLSTVAAERIDAAEILVSPVSCWEVAMLVGKARLRLDRPVQAWVADVLAAEGVEVAPLTAQVAVAAASLSELHGDPADRFLVATAAASRVPLVTKDGLIHAYARSTGHLDVVW